MIFTMLVFVLLSIVLIWVYQWFARYLFFHTKLKSIPGPRNVPFLGVAWDLRNIPREDRFGYIRQINNKYKDGIFILWISSMPFVHIRKPKHMETLLRSHVNIKKGSIYDTIKPWLGEGLVTSTGAIWSHHRRMITPAFHFGVLEEYATVMRERAEGINEKIRAELKANPGKPINIFALAIEHTLGIICETAMGVSVDSGGPHKYYVEALHKYARLSSERFVKPWLSYDFVYYNLSSSGKESKRCVKIMHDFTNKVIEQKYEERRANKQKVGTENSDVDDLGKKKRKAFLDLLLDASENSANPLSATELREEVDTFMFAGHDTTSTSISWTLFALGNQPEIQDKIQEELREVFGDSKETATSDELAKLKYLDRVIKESLRINPVAPIISRELVEDTEIGGYMVPKGCTISVLIYDLHHDPEIWENPDNFDPDRFLPENMKGRNPFAYIPFSAGPRNCIGQKFAILEIKTSLVAILRKWRVRSVLKPKEIKKIANFTLRPHEDKIEIYFTPINSS